MTEHSYIELGIAVLKIESEAISALTDRLDQTFHHACDLILGCKGRIVVTGMGKSGHIGNKIAATLASTGTPAFFMHPGEASHGDLGMITADDLVIALSNSGETNEITLLLPLLKRLGIPLIALTGNSHSTIAQAADINLDVSVRNDAGKPIAKGLLTYRAVDSARQSAPDATQRQRVTEGDDVMREPAATGDDVPRLARAIVTVPFMARLGLDIAHMRDGGARISMPFNPDHADDTGATHEGAVAALLDTTGAMASWSITGIDFHYKASTVGIHVNYHAPATGEDVVALARTLRRNNEVFLNQVSIRTRPSNRLIATGSVTYRIVIPDRSAGS